MSKCQNLHKGEELSEMAIVPFRKPGTVERR
jgi:hypothetical protein